MLTFAISSVGNAISSGASYNNLQQNVIPQRKETCSESFNQDEKPNLKRCCETFLYGIYKTANLDSTNTKTGLVEENFYRSACLQQGGTKIMQVLGRY